MKQVCLIGVLVLAVAVSHAHVQRGTGERFTCLGKTYEQELPKLGSGAYPKWNPAAGACPLHPTNAVAIAGHAATNAIPDSMVRKGSNPKLSLHSDSGEWYYLVGLSITTEEAAGNRFRRGGSASIMVGLDGKVPPIKFIPKEELNAEREEVRANLRQYQMEVIRAGMPPLAIPLTQEMDDQLVAEGVLPPAKTNTTPRRFGSGFRRAPGPNPEVPPGVKRKQAQDALREYQEEAMRAGMPPLAELFPQTNAPAATGK
ncbi:hypothetical protein [Pontiella desulfatans]|nr:hypothetical protein [Pontiella desulfatans]